MQTMTAFEKLTTRPRPMPVTMTKPQPEVRSTHAAVCPACGTEVRVTAAEWADVFNSCVHFAGVELIGDQVSIVFNARPK